MIKLNKKIFGERLKLLLEENNETIYDIAQVVSLTPGTISRYRNGEMSPKITTIQVMANYYNVNPSWLMGLNVDRSLNLTIPEIPTLIFESEKNNVFEIYQMLNEENKIIFSTLIDKLLDEQKNNK